MWVAARSHSPPLRIPMTIASALLAFAAARNDLYRMTEFDLYFLYSFSEIGIGCCLDLQFGFSFNSAPLRARPDVGVNGPDH